MENTNQMFSNETIFKTIREMVKQFKNIEDEDEYREKCIQCVYNAFNLDIYDAEIIYDLACFWNGEYLTDTDSEVEFLIQKNENWTFTATEIKLGGDYKKSYIFNDIPITLVLTELNYLAKKEFD